MKSPRERLQGDIAAFLAAGGVIQQCDSADNASARVQPVRSRREQLVHRKRLDGYERYSAVARRKGGGK
ncbi:hypothetical protein [Parahaliea aestuarii]